MKMVPKNNIIFSLLNLPLEENSSWNGKNNFLFSKSNESCLRWNDEAKDYFQKRTKSKFIWTNLLANCKYTLFLFTQIH